MGTLVRNFRYWLLVPALAIFLMELESSRTGQADASGNVPSVEQFFDVEVDPHRSEGSNIPPLPTSQELDESRAYQETAQIPNGTPPLPRTWFLFQAELSA